MTKARMAKCPECKKNVRIRADGHPVKHDPVVPYKPHWWLSCKGSLKAVGKRLPKVPPAECSDCHRWIGVKPDGQLNPHFFDYQPCLGTLNLLKPVEPVKVWPVSSDNGESCQLPPRLAWELVRPNSVQLLAG